MRRRAFTILELLAATALAALLMLAVFHVVGTLGASRAAVAATSGNGATVRGDLLDTLRRDLAGATQVSFRANGMTLTGHGSLDRATLLARQEPVLVDYGLVVIGGRRWLVRRQGPRDGLSRAPAWTELVRPDVVGFSVRPAAVAGVVADVGNGPGDSTKQDVPAAVTIRFEDAAGVVSTETVVVR